MSNELTPGTPAFQDTSTPQTVLPGALKLSAAAVAGFASGKVTIGGTPTTGDTAKATINGHDVSVNPTTGQSDADVASALATAINADGTSSLIVHAAPSGNDCVITALVAGAPGLVTLAASATGGHTTATAGASQLDLANNVIIPKHTFAWIVGHGDKAVTFYQGVPVYDNAGQKAALRAAGKIY